MLLLDVNILVYAQRQDMPHHEDIRQWLQSRLIETKPILLFEPVLASYLRIVTNPRIFNTPTPMDMALAFADSLRASPSCKLATIPENHWKIFTRGCVENSDSGDQAPDAYLAALAIAYDAEFITLDRGFSRYKGLRWRQPS